MPKPLNPLTGQAEFNGTSIIDVTDPAQAEIPVPHPRPGGQFRSRRRADDARLRRQTPAEGRPYAVYLLRTFGGARPRDLERRRSVEARAGLEPSWDLQDTHKSFWECDTGIAYLVSGVDGWRITPHDRGVRAQRSGEPVKIRDFGLVGQEPGATGTVPTDLHGMISTGPQAQPRLFRLRHQQGRRDADRRPRTAAEGPEGANAGEPARIRSCRQVDLLPITARTPPCRCWRCRSPNSPRTRTARPAISS